MKLAPFLLLLASPVWAQSGHTVEREPNGTIVTATRAALGDTLTGEIADENDVDYFAIDVPAGTTLRMSRTKGDVVSICLYDLDQTTWLACFGTIVETEFLSYQLTVGGRYLLRVERSHPSADVVVTGPYAFSIDPEPLRLGSGDPALTVANTDLRWARYRLATGQRGELYALVLGEPSTILRFNDYLHTGPVIPVPIAKVSGGLAVDGFGDLLISGQRILANAIWRLSENGDTTLFAANLGPRYTDDGFNIAIGPDGDVWAGEVDKIWRFSPTGVLKSTIDLPLCSFASLAVSPKGVLHFTGEASGCRGVFAVTDAGRQAVLRDTVGDLAFDRDGNLYVGVWTSWDYSASPPSPYPLWAHVTKFDSTYRFVEHVAHVMDLRGLVFARGQNGSISSRLVTMQSELGRIVELSGAGNRVAGLFPGQFFHAEVAALAPGTLGGSYRDTLHLRAQGGAPRVWSIERGTLPPGLTLTSEGMIQGIPTQVGTFAFTLRTDQGAFAFFSEGTITVITAEQIVDALVGSQPLPQAVATALDQRGNLNGELDVGDLRAYLRAQGRVLSPILRALVASPN